MLETCQVKNIGALVASTKSENIFQNELPGNGAYSATPGTALL